METLSKSAFADHIGVSPARISQYLKSGMIDVDCLVKDATGREKIVVAKAVEQIRRKRNIGQALGNGLGTRLDDRPADVTSTPAGPPSPRVQTVDDEIKAERLESERRKNRLAALEEATNLGQLVPADQVRAEMGKLARQVDEENGAMLADFATAIAAKYELPQRDILHLLRQVRSDKKAAVSARAKARADSLPQTTQVGIDDEVAA